MGGRFRDGIFHGKRRGRASRFHAAQSTKKGAIGHLPHTESYLLPTRCCRRHNDEPLSFLQGSRFTTKVIPAKHVSHLLSARNKNSPYTIQISFISNFIQGRVSHPTSPCPLDIPPIVGSALTPTTLSPKPPPRIQKKW